MNEPQASPVAWQPLTPRGVAAFARAGTGRLWLVQTLVALGAAGAITWFVATAWCPTIEAAIERLPDSGEIRDGQLFWPGASPMRLAEGTFLALNVDPDHTGALRSPADVEVEFGRSSIVFRSLLGEAELVYPPRGAFAFSQPALKPWWGAWKPAALAGVAAGTFLALFVCWQLLATLYAPVAWLIAFYADRELTFTGSWRLAGAALMPGALWMTLATVLYGAGAMDLLRWLVAFGSHLPIGWAYLVLGALAAPRCADALKRRNPFASPNRG
ncbi:MAG: hypothetical protein N3I86_10380 [Verrucomicrobiae bacterium]|nr:hypothetical protein [Verrucomicrobiae bacterium]